VTLAGKPEAFPSADGQSRSGHLCELMILIALVYDRRIPESMTPALIECPYRWVTRFFHRFDGFPAPWLRFGWEVFSMPRFDGAAPPTGRPF